MFHRVREGRPGGKEGGRELYDITRRRCASASGKPSPQYLLRRAPAITVAWLMEAPAERAAGAMLL